MNDALRRALMSAGLDHADVAARLGVDPKTVEQWCAGRVPYARNRAALAALVGRDEHVLWPTSGHTRPRVPPGGEILTIYPHRWAVPRETWLRLFSRAERGIGILAYSALFLIEDPGITRTLADRARAGIRVRLLLGDPDSPEVAERGKEEGIGDAMSARVRNALALLRPLTALPAVEIRLHRTALYNSIYRADDDLLVNPHVYGQPAATAPVLHTRQTHDGILAANYLESFERVWGTSGLNG
ncbi:XRE family transcriptional regulator [Streptomyces sp. NBC_01190]|uniref:XRE family transcriptional regulator n=1 Tax=Streptomyces sp. NBC_01190 TaxID=2903767 RepID=UPI00386CA6B3|nr:XRE family transcriptional regulator [Streptomyces sp. NBC_01190]